jgi:hypothetical protein
MTGTIDLLPLPEVEVESRVGGGAVIINEVSQQKHHCCVIKSCSCREAERQDVSVRPNAFPSALQAPQHTAAAPPLLTSHALHSQAAAATVRQLRLSLVCLGQEVSVLLVRCVLEHCWGPQLW